MRRFWKDDVILIPAGKGGPLFKEALLDHKDFWDVSHWTLEPTQLLSLQSRYWKLILSTADMKVKGSTIRTWTKTWWFLFWEVRENLEKAAKKNPGNGHNWHNLKFQHFIAPCHTCLFSLRWSSSSSLERWQVMPVKRKVQLFGWNCSWDWSLNGIGGVIYICIVYLFLKYRALWNTLGL